MGILAECSTCHKKQSVNNRLCSCGEDLVKAKKSKRIRYWINYRLPGGKQKRESVGFSIEVAKDAIGKRRSQKRENRIFDIKAEAKMTFNELSKWYLKLAKVKATKYYPTIEVNLGRFNRTFGNKIVGELRPADLEEFQAEGQAEGYADATIDHAIGAIRTMIIKAFNNDIVSGDTLRVFNRVGKLLKKNANARDKVLSVEEFDKLLEALPAHSKPIVATGYYAGMRKNEVLKLTWDKVDMKNREIELLATDTKTKKKRKMPICNDLYEILKSIPRSLHDNHVFLYRGKPITDIRSALRRACRDVGIPYGRKIKDGFVYHDTRRTFNTNMDEAGVAEAVTMNVTGHSSREMFDRYRSVKPESRRLAIDKLQAHLDKERLSVDQNVDQAPVRGK